MQLHQLPSIKERRHKRIGRSGKRGSYSGRGVKGQKSRAGRRLRPAERDLILRIPKRRGFANAAKSEKPKVFNLGELSLRLKSYADGAHPLEVTKDLLKTAGLLPKGGRSAIKILGDGDLAFPIIVQGLAVSAGAKTKIEKAGGSVSAAK